MAEKLALPSSERLDLHTERLLLRAAVGNDAQSLYHVFRDPEVMTYWSEPPHPSLERTQEWVSSMIHNNSNGIIDFVICLKPDEAPIGKIGVWQGDEIGFVLARSEWHKGSAKEALDKMLPYLFDVRNFASISADVDPRNQASIGLLKRFGFEESGYEENTLKVGDEWVHSLYLRLRREQWYARASI